MSALLRLLGPLKLPLLYVAIGAMVVIGAYRTGVNAERRAGEAAALRQQIETLRDDMRLAAEAQASAAAKGAALDALNTQLTEELDALRTDLAGRPEGDRYPATDADLDRLYGRQP